LDPRARRLTLEAVAASPRNPRPWLTVAALAVTGLLGWFVYLPGLYQLAVAACRALFPWYTWYEPYWERAIEVQLWGTWLPLPAALVGTYAVLRHLSPRFVKALRAPPRSGWRKVLPRLGWGLLTLATLPSAAALAVTLAVPVMAFGPGYYTTSGRHLQRQSCSHCHNPHRPFHFFRPPEQWATTVHRMRTLEGAPIDEHQEERIATYLASRCSHTDGWMFRARCLRCHDRDALEATPRSAEEWALVVDRVSHLSPSAYRPDWKRQLVAHTADELAEGEAPQDKLAFEIRCGACHELSLALRTADAEATVRSMLDKVASDVTEAERAAIVQYVTGAPRDPDELRALFPHDAPVEVPW